MFGIPGFEKYIPIPATKAKRSTKKGDKDRFEFRVNFHTEPSIAVTPFKGQGMTENNDIIEIKNMSSNIISERHLKELN